MTKENKIKYAMNIMFFLYFIVLIVERTISVIQTLMSEAKILSSPFNIFVYFTIFVSIIGFVVYLVIKCRLALVGLFKPSKIEEVDFKKLVCASGILLLSGMVHSEYTISVIQFVSYGFFIVAIILEGILNQKEVNSKVLMWMSIAYLVAYSMAIPVTYPSNIEAHIFFHILEGVASYLLVGSFTCMTLMIFGKKDDLFNPIFIVLALVLDIPLIIMRWNEEINFFVLIFIALSSVLFIVGFIMSPKGNEEGSLDKSKEVE